MRRAKRPVMLLLMTWLILVWGRGTTAAYAAAGPTPQPPPYPTMTPAPAPTPTPAATSAPNVLLDPSGAIKSLATGMLKDVFEDIDATLEDILNKVVRWLWRLATMTPAGGIYSTAAKPFSAVGIVLFVPMAVLRLVWHQKRVLIGENDTLVNVAFDILVAAVMVLGVGPFTDWTAEKVYTLTGVVLEKIGVHGFMFQSESLGQLVGAVQSEAFGLLLFGGLALLGGILAFLAFGMAFLAVHGVLYVLVALGPIVFTVGMLPPFGWTKRLWWMGFGATMLTPFIGAAALGAFMLVFSPYFGSDLPLVKFVIRLVWLWAAAGMMWSLLGVMTRFTFAASLQAAGKVVGSVTAAVGGLTAAGALTGAPGVLGGLSGLSTGEATGTGGAPAGANGEGAAPGENGGSRAVGSAASPAEHFERAASHTLQAGRFSALSQVPGLGGLRAAAMYHRTLADAHRMLAFAGSKPQGKGAGGNGETVETPHLAAQSLFSKLGGGGNYDDALSAVQSRLQGVEDPKIGPVMPRMWSEQNSEHASLAARLAALYQQEPQLFEDVQSNPDRWFEIKAKAYDLPIRGKGE